MQLMLLRDELHRQAAWENQPDEIFDGAFLPIELNGIQVLEHEGCNEWFVDNSVLQADTDGLAYRRSANLDDRVVGDPCARWGFRVKGIARGADWVQTQATFKYLPMKLRKKRVLVPRGTSGDEWVVDNSYLKDNTHGLGYRGSM